MIRKTMSMLLVTAVLLAFVGCRKEEPAPTKTTKQTPPPGEKAPTGRTQQPTPVGGADANQATAGAQKPAGQMADAQQKQAYVQQAEQTLSTLEQKMKTWQQQAKLQGPEAEKAQQLQQRLQQEIADARAALDKARTASGEQWKQARVAADQAIGEAEAAFKDLLSYAESQRQVTKAQ